jgi:Gram-negative porin
MFGGLTKTASRMALVAAAGTLMTGTAFAADLGGDCCADLEERVAELEATTARKGNRKVSLTISGQVNRASTYWNDGSRSNMQFGDDNHNSSTRFGFAGNAKIAPNYTAGFSMVIDVADKSRTSQFSQTNDIGSSKFAGGGATRNGDDQAIRLRDANWWIESSQLGRVTVGRLTTEGALGTIDLGGIAAAVGDDIGCNGGGLRFRNSTTGLLTGRSIGNTSEGGCSGPWANRAEGIKYTSPTFAGFVFVTGLTRNLKTETTHVDSTVATVAPRGHELFAALRYAGEFSGVRVAASAGYTIEDNARDTGGIFYSNADGIVTNGAAIGVAGSGTSGKTTLIDTSLSLMHVASGLFATGNYSKVTYDSTNPSGGANIGARDANRWRVVAGISQNWFGLGKTALYGEYARHNDFAYATTGYTVSGAGCAIATAASTCNFSNGATAVANVLGKGDSVRTWGIGANQAIDAAAMDLYINYRNHSLTDPSLAAGVSTKSIDVVTTGARIRF